MLDSVYHLERLHFPHLLALGGIEDPRWKWATDKVAELQAENKRLRKLLNIALPQCNCKDIVHCVSCGHRAALERKEA